MASTWRRPNRRNPETLQVEVCDLCGRYVGAQDRYLSWTEGFRGRYVCTDHGTLTMLPSANDLGWPGNSPTPWRDLEPHSGANWGYEEWD